MPRSLTAPNFRAAVAALALVSLVSPAVHGQSDLDAFMKHVMERRDDNWTKLQQYILDEREEFDVRGPGRIPLWGEQRDFTWFIQDGFFVRSPLAVNGATVGEDDRRTYEADYLRRAMARDRRERERAAKSSAAAADGRQPPGPEPAASEPRSLDGFIQQTRQPEFISSAYFLRFKFDSGRYALVGPEQFEGTDVLRVEYYPTKLFTDQDRRARRQDRGRDPDADPSRDPVVDSTVNRLVNRGSRVTLWIEPKARQIIKYTFDNVDLDFFPGQWLASVTGVHASMTMGQPFPDVWLPRETEFEAGVMLAVGELDVRGTVRYHDYRRAEVTSAIRVPGAR